MNLIAICIAFIVSIVSVGAPLVFQVISTLDEKYRSEKVIDLFKKESNFKLMKWLLRIVPVTILLYIIISTLLVQTHIAFFDKLLDLFSLLLLLSTTFLVAQFIYFSFKVLKYSIPTSFIRARINYLKKSTKKIENEDNLEVVTNLFIYSIQKELIDTCSLIPDYMFYVFFNYRENFKDELLEFPDKFYKTTYLITQELALSNSDRLKKLDYNASGFYWLVGEDKRMTEKTYSILWINLSLLIVYKKDDSILKYWKQAFDHFEYRLRIPSSIYLSPSSREKVNQVEIDKIEKERSEFLDFHYYLAGLLLSENRIECIRRIWDHTNSEPPRYPLLPFAMGEIFKRYFDLCQSFDNKSREKAARFNFPKVDSVNYDWIVNSWIRRYLILLFLRQYTLYHYYTYDNFLELPNSPESQAEKKHWIDNIQMFIDGVKEVLANAELLKALRFDHITEEWCEAEKKIYPLELVDKFKRKLEEDFGQANINQSISPEKEKKFLASSKEIIEKALLEYDEVLNKNNKTENVSWKKPFYIIGNKQLASKSDFSDDQPYDHWNYDSFLAEQVANKIRWAISETFLLVTTQGYLLKAEDLFKAIDNLKITENANDFVIISFKNNIDYYINVLQIPVLSKSFYNGVTLIDIWNCNGHIVGYTFFILRKSDLPWLEFKEPANQYDISLKKENIIIPERYISAFIIDLHNNPTVIKEQQEKGNKENLEDKVLVDIEMLALIHWKEGAKVIALQTASAYEDRGIPNKLEEVKPFDEI